MLYVPRSNTSCRKLISTATEHAPRMGRRLVADILAALSVQTVGPGAAAADTVLPMLAGSLKTVLKQGEALAVEVDGILDAHPLAEALTSMPGIGGRTAACVCGRSATPPLSPWLPMPASPVTHRSGSSIRGGHPGRTLVEARVNVVVKAPQR